VRVAALLALAGALTGVLLIVAGFADLHWWGTPTAGQLIRLMERIDVELGVPQPALLRHGAGAVELIVVGAACLPYAILAPLILKGRRWARTAGLALGLVTFLVGMAGIGADATQPHVLKSYLQVLASAGESEMIPQVRALVNPAWYGWLEDVAQGLQALVSLATVLALTATAVMHPHFFTAGKATPQVPDEWTAAISRIREQNATPEPPPPPPAAPSPDDTTSGRSTPTAKPAAGGSREPAYDTSMYRRKTPDE